MSQRKRKMILAVVATDRTFERVSRRDERYWQGKCLFCRRHLLVEIDGTPISDVTIEHIVPRSSGGNDELANLGLACSRCNHEKGLRHDHRGLGDAKLAEVVGKLQEERRKRWRDMPGD